MARKLLAILALWLVLPAVPFALQDPDPPSGGDSTDVDPGDADEKQDEGEEKLSEFLEKQGNLLPEKDGLEKLATALNVGGVNSALSFLDKGHGLRFLKDVQFELKSFTSEGTDTAFGFSYNYSKSWDQYRKGSSGKEWGIDLEFETKGNVAFNKEVHNPEDFLDTHFRLKTFRNSGGVSSTASYELADRMNKLDDEAADFTNGDELAASNAAQELDEIYQSMFSNQLYLDFSLHAGLEANQTFSQRQFTYGAELGIVYWPWDKDSMGSNFNLFDYPFAFLRLLTGYDDEFRTIGATMPSLLIGIDQVNPTGKDPRAVAGDTSDFARVRGEVAFRTPVALIGDPAEGGPSTAKDAGGSGAITVYFDATWRTFHELGASSAVESADLDRFDYLEVALRSSNGIFLSFTDGQLPFDLSDEQTLQVGFSFNL